MRKIINKNIFLPIFLASISLVTLNAGELGGEKYRIDIGKIISNLEPAPPVLLKPAAKTVYRIRASSKLNLNIAYPKELNMLSRAGITVLEEQDYIEASNFNLPDIDGKYQRLSDLRGQVVVLNFWATWCPPCRAEMPTLQQMTESLADKPIVLLAVDVGESSKDVTEFIQENEFTFKVLLDENSAVAHEYQAFSLPTTYVIDPAGKVVAGVIGSIDWDKEEIYTGLNALLGE